MHQAEPLRFVFFTVWKVYINNKETTVLTSGGCFEEGIESPTCFRGKTGNKYQLNIIKYERMHMCVLVSEHVTLRGKWCVCG